ncbi:MAG: hypothetical protein AABY18_02620 [Candidatus Thermoplasmatota archaeon]
MKALLVVALVAALTLAGCSGGKGKKEQPTFVLPPEINERDINRLSNLASKFPTAFSFEGQQALEPVIHWINGTVEAGTGSTGIELPNDDGPIDYGGDILTFDLADKVPVGQPVEVRINLKWWGDPGRGADLDIYVDMPGERGALNPEQYDESNNWNIVNKARVVNSVHLEGKPFLVGLQVNNGRIVDPAGIPYSMKVDLNFVANVLPPATPYALQVPENSTFIVVDTERVVGDEHVDVDFVVVGPDDKRIWSMHHNDIGQETLSISVRGGGEYIVYAQRMHGGFLRIESEIPNEQFIARQLELTETEVMLHAGPAPAPGTYAEQGGVSSNSFGAEGTFDVGPTFPLDIIPVITASGGSVDVAINVTSPVGWLITTFARGAYEDERGRVGDSATVRMAPGRETMDVGTYSFGVVSNTAGASLSVLVLSYVR